MWEAFSRKDLSKIFHCQYLRIIEEKNELGAITAFFITPELNTLCQKFNLISYTHC